MSDNNSFWICPMCGPRVACDEDGCCRSCGSTTFGSEEDWFVALRAKEQEELLRLRVRVEEVTAERDALKKELIEAHRYAKVVFDELRRGAPASPSIDPDEPRCTSSTQLAHEIITRAVTAESSLAAERAKRESAEARVAEVEEALRPFAECGILRSGLPDEKRLILLIVGDADLSVGDFRRAARALAQQAGTDRLGGTTPNTVASELRASQTTTADPSSPHATTCGTICPTCGICGTCKGSGEVPKPPIFVREVAAFEREKDRLIAEHGENGFVLVKGDDVLGWFGGRYGESGALAAGYRLSGLDELFMVRELRREERVIQMRGFGPPMDPCPSCAPKGAAADGEGR